MGVPATLPQYCNATMNASTWNTPDGYTVVVWTENDTHPAWQPIANFGDCQYLAIELRNDIVNGRIDDHTIEKMIRNYGK